MAPRVFGVRIGIFSLGLEPGDEEFVNEFSAYGDQPGQIMWPAGIAINRHGIIYVTDEWLNRISVFDRTGTFLTTLGSYGSGENQFNRPSGICTDNDDNIFIVDSLNHRIQKLDSDGSVITTWGSYGAEEGEFNSPWGISLDKNGHIYVADHKNHRIQKFDPNGRFKTQFGKFGIGIGEMTRPSDIAVDPDGDVYVCDWANSRIQIYDPNGNFLTSLVGNAHELTKWAKHSVDSNPDLQKARRRVRSLEPEQRFAMPTGVTFDKTMNRLIVADTQRYRLQIYNKITDYIEPQFNL